MKKTSIVLAVLLVLLLTTCTQKKEIAVGKYYLGSNDKVFIEIIDNTKIVFSNVDFSGIEATFLSDFGVVIDIAKHLSSEYTTNNNFDRIYVELIFDDTGEDGFRPAIHFGYADKDKTLTLDGKIYTKR